MILDELKYEFDDAEELHKALETLSDYHDCEQCHGKIVMITGDGFGNTKCGYCGQIVKYPKLSTEAFERVLREEKNGER